MQLAEKFFECREIFKKYESRGDCINANISHVMGEIFSKLNDIQTDMHNEVVELTQNIELKILKPLNDYQVRHFHRQLHLSNSLNKNLILITFTLF